MFSEESLEDKIAKIMAGNFSLGMLPENAAPSKPPISYSSAPTQVTQQPYRRDYDKEPEDNNSIRSSPTMSINSQDQGFGGRKTEQPIIKPSRSRSRSYSNDSFTSKLPNNQEFDAPIYINNNMHAAYEVPYDQLPIGQDMSAIASTTIHAVDEIGYDDMTEEPDNRNEYPELAVMNPAVAYYPHVISHPELSESPLDLQKALLEDAEQPYMKEDIMYDEPSPMQESFRGNMQHEYEEDPVIHPGRSRSGSEKSQSSSSMTRTQPMYSTGREEQPMIYDEDNMSENSERSRHSLPQYAPFVSESVSEKSNSSRNPPMNISMKPRGDDRPLYPSTESGSEKSYSSRNSNTGNFQAQPQLPPQTNRPAVQPPVYMEISTNETVKNFPKQQSVPISNRKKEEQPLLVPKINNQNTAKARQVPTTQTTNKIITSPTDTNYESLHDEQPQMDNQNDRTFTMNDLKASAGGRIVGKKDPPPQKVTIARNLEKTYAEPQQVTRFTTPVAKPRSESPQSVVSTTLIEHPITVAVRVRPFSAYEKSQSSKRTISVIGSDLIVVNPNSFDAEPDSVAAAAVAIDNDQWAHSFRFDNCLWSYDETTGSTSYANQVEVHDSIGLDIVEHALSGVSCTCFAYGYSNTGKTYSLFGNIPTAATKPVNITKKKEVGFYGLNSNSGLVPRVFHDIVTAIKTNCISTPGSRIFISFLEIYNEKIVDLLAESNVPTNTSNMSAVKLNNSVIATSSVDSLKVREHPTLGPYVENLRKVEVFSAEDALQLITKGQANRKTTQTFANSETSKSHAIVTLELAAYDLNADSKKLLDSTTKRSSSTSRLARSSTIETPKRPVDKSKTTESNYKTVKVQMVDLMSNDKDDESENGPTNAAYGPRSPEHKEHKIVRKSIGALGQIIHALSKGAALKTLPYRDSVLTFLLRDALNGQNFTTMLATISPSHLCYEETLTTLRYAENLCAIRKKPSIGTIRNSPKYEPTLTLRDHRPQLIEEFRKFHHDLGSTKKGTLASRQLLQFTVSDPQQRIAKLTRASTPLEKGPPSTPHRTPNASEAIFTSPIDGTVKRFKEITIDDLTHLQSSYRNLQGQVIELQIDIDSLRTDRDTLLVELRSAKDQLVDVENERKESNTRISNLLKSLKQTEKEVHELRMLNKRQEEQLERTSLDLQEQKQGRINAEQSYHARTKEFLTRFEQMKKENKALQATIELTQNRDGIYQNEKIELLSQIQKCKNELESLSQSIEHANKENQYLKDQNMLLQQKMSNYDELTQFNASIQKDMGTLNAQYHRKNEDFELLRNEYQSLLSIIEQKDSLLWLQNQQSEYSKKILHQQQQTIERNELHHMKMQDWLTLQENLKTLFQQEKSFLLNEIVDTNHLIKLIQELRLKLQEYQNMQQEFELEKQKATHLEEKILQCFQIMKQNDDEKQELYQTNDELQQQIQELQSLYFLNSHLPNNRHLLGADKPNYPPNISIQQKLFLENEQLILQNKQLTDKYHAAQQNMEQQKQELVKKEDKMQKEFQNLWKSVQELQKLDVLKDQSIEDLLREKKQMYDTNQSLSQQVDQLTKELQDIDIELERAAAVNAMNVSFPSRNPPMMRQMQNPQMHTMRTPMQQQQQLPGPMMIHPHSNGMNMNMNMNGSNGTNSTNGPINGNAIYQSYSTSKGMGVPPPPPPQQQQQQQQPPSRSYNNTNPIHSTPLPPRDFHNNSHLSQPYPYNNSYDGSLNDSEQILTNQIDELSGILDDEDRFKRSRTRTGGAGAGAGTGAGTGAGAGAGGNSGYGSYGNSSVSSSRSSSPQHTEQPRRMRQTGPPRYNY